MPQNMRAQCSEVGITHFKRRVFAGTHAGDALTDPNHGIGPLPASSGFPPGSRSDTEFTFKLFRASQEMRLSHAKRREHVHMRLKPDCTHCEGTLTQVASIVDGAVALAVVTPIVVPEVLVNTV